MTEAHERVQWGRFSALMALVANAHRDPHKHSSVRPEAFNPYTSRDNVLQFTRGQRPKAKLSVLRDVFCKKK